MTNKAISQLTAGSSVTSTDIFPDVQSAGVGPVKVTAAQIGNYVLTGAGMNGALTLGTAGTTAGSLVLSGSTSGVVTLATAATAGTWTFTLPTSGGTNGYILTTNGSGVSSWTNPTALGIDLDVGSTAITSATDKYILYNNNGTLGNYAVTGTGTTAVLSTSPTFTTGLTTPLAVGGTTASSSLTLKSTSGVGTSDSIVFKVGNNGGTTAATINTSGYFGIGTSSNTTSILMTSATVANNGAVIGTIDATTLRVQNLSTANIGTSSKLYLDIGGLGGAVVQGYYAAFNGSGDIAVGLAFATQATTGGGPQERMRIEYNGNVGIGTTSPATLLHVNGTIRYTNRPAAGTITAIGFDANGDLKASSSSLRYKENIQDYEKGLSEVLSLRPVTFTFKDENKINAGFIVEEIDAEGLEEYVLRNELNDPDAIPYGNMVALLTKAIQELAAKVTALEAANG